MPEPGDQFPIRWPEGWAEQPDLLADTPLNHILKPDTAVPAGVTVVQSKTWPKVRTSDGGGSSAGPTGVPWIDANGWRLQMARVKEPGKPVWLAVDPPKDALPAEYELAIAEAEAYGGRWILSLDPGLRDGLAARQEAALASWKRMSAALRFFSMRKAFHGWPSAAGLLVVSDFAGPNQFLAGEVLNLLARRYVAARPELPGGPWTQLGAPALLYVDRLAPQGALLERMTQYAAGGGIAILPFETKAPAGTPEEHPNFSVYAVGKGRMAIARKRWADPYQLSSDAHLLMGRRNDVLRLWNGGTLNAHYTIAADGSRGVVHLLNFSKREAAHDLTLGVAKPWKSARMVTWHGTTSLKAEIANHWVEIALPPVEVYAAVELA